MKRVYILGGGPCGIAMAHALSLGKVPVTLIEASDRLGGLAKTIEWGASKMDLGPHKLFTLNEELMQKILALRPASTWIEHAKTSRIYMNGHYLNYPPSPIDLWKTFGTYAFIQSCFGMLFAKIRGVISSPGANTFEEDARARVGGTLYRLFFQPLANKIWGDPQRLDATLSKSRIQVPSVRKTLANLYRPSQKNTWQANTYRYPGGGLSTLWDTMEKTIRDQGGDIMMKDPVKVIDLDAAGYVTRIALENGKSFALTQEDWVFSTLPFARLARMMNPVPPNEVLRQTEALELNDLWLIFLKVRGDVLKGNAWIFAPDNSVVFHRVSTQRKFDPGMIEHGFDLVCCEVMNYPGKPTAALSDDAITQQCVQGLIRMELLESADLVSESKILKLPRSYPVMTTGYQETQAAVLNYFDRFKNLRTIGRQGAYNYIGTLDAMDTGFGAAAWFMNPNRTEGNWTEERKRTMFYPILD